jgi:phage/plasmid-like protein (TIGR03299 family)
MVMKADANHYDRETPWQTLGVDVTEAHGIADVARLAGMDFQVGTSIPVVNGTPQESFRAVHRLDNNQTFGFAKKGYTPLQYLDAFSFLDGLGGFTLESAGTIKGGARAFIQAKLDRTIVVEGDTIQPYFYIGTSHDGSMGVKMILGALRIRCTNQFPMLGRTAISTWSHRHSTNVLENAQVAAKALVQVDDELDAFEEEVRRLMETEVSDRRFKAIVANVFPMSDSQTLRQRENVQVQRDEVQEAYVLSMRDGGDFIGSGWGVVNAFNSWGQWSAPIRSTSNLAERQAVKTLDGTFGAMTRKVAELVLA